MLSKSWHFWCLKQMVFCYFRLCLGDSFSEVKSLHYFQNMPPLVCLQLLWYLGSCFIQYLSCLFRKSCYRSPTKKIFLKHVSPNDSTRHSYLTLFKVTICSKTIKNLINMGILEYWDKYLEIVEEIFDLQIRPSKARPMSFSPLMPGMDHSRSIMHQCWLINWPFLLFVMLSVIPISLPAQGLTGFVAAIHL